MMLLLIELTAEIISKDRSSYDPLQEDSNSIPEPVDRDENVVSIWKTIDTKVAQLQSTGTVTSRAIIEVQRYLEDSIVNRNWDPLKSLPQSVGEKNVMCSWNISAM
ncbi:unnamed protein product [Macrosiphum euphorbiae]|uniref:Uncharacterized protein n=1 Tax=Macrosiphum euphorbiae TaxID=13131 RepID=A0AAV0WT50_9HEMI|nr:unnamed protein product [Macrosiphum euphorbiae]